MRNALYFPIVEEYSTGFGALHEALHCLRTSSPRTNTLNLLEALQTPANITNTAPTRLSGTRPETWLFRDRRRACPFANVPIRPAAAGPRIGLHTSLRWLLRA